MESLDTPEEVQDAGEDVEEFLPETFQAVEPDDAVGAAEEVDPFDTAASDDGSVEEVVVTQPAPAPLAKSWAFDFNLGQFFHAGQRGPTPTFGLVTLRYWIEKCLMTERGGSLIHSESYGIEGLTELIGEPQGVLSATLRDRVTDALTFHPRISEVADFEITSDPDNEYVEVSFTVITDEEDDLTIQGLNLRIQ